MSDEAEVVEEVVEEQAVEPAPDQEETGTLESEEEVAQEEDENTAPAKTFTQEELDAAVGKRLARERRKLEREYSQKEQAATAPQVDVSDLKPEFFATSEEYTDAIAERKADAIVAQREAHKTQSTVSNAYLEKEEKARDRYVDYDQVARSQDLPVTQLMADAIKNAENGPDILYHLGSDPKEAKRISELPPLAQAMAIGRIEATLKAPEQKKTSSAPAPIAPIGGSKGVINKDPGKMSEDEYSEWRMERKQKYGA